MVGRQKFHEIETLPELSRSETEIKERIDQEFFVRYSNTSALYRSSRRPGQAIEFFHKSRQDLEQELGTVRKTRIDDESLDNIAVRHALLSLIHWLFPNYIGYNRLVNARLMYQHARAATSAARSRLSLPYAIGLMIQLRIAPFLIRTKRLKESQLTRMRELAIAFVEKYRNDTDLQGILGIMQDGVGFSYFLYERDLKTSAEYLAPAIERLFKCERLSIKSVSVNRSTIARVQVGFFRAFLSTAHWDYGICCESKSENSEGEQMLTLLKETRYHYQRAYEFAKHTTWNIYKAMSAHNIAGTFAKEATLQLEVKSTVECLKKAVDLGERSLRWFRLWSPFEGDFLGGSWIATFYQQLANRSEPSKRKKLMNRSLELASRAERILSDRRIGLVRYKLVNLGDIFFHNAEYFRSRAIQTKNSEQAQEHLIKESLEKALENCLRSRKYFKDDAYKNRLLESSLLAGDVCYELMNLASDQTRKRQSKASKRYFVEAFRISSQMGSNEKVAESCWRIGQVLDKLGNFRESADYYQKAHEAYSNVGNSQEIRMIYSDPSNYMLAWSHIEQAKLAHRVSEFEKASQLYKDAAELILGTSRWQSRAHLYFAESLIEKSERESLSENAQSSVQYFVDAVQELSKLQSELRNVESEDSKSFMDLANRMISYCNARIILEKSKEAYRIGDAEQSVKGLSLAEEIFHELAENSETSDSLGSNELGSLSSLCKALVSFQTAQMTDNSELYLEAEGIFRRAAETSKSKSLRPLLIGLSNFATFLYYSKQIEESLESSLDVEKLLECNKALDSAGLTFRRLGNKSFLNMLKASKHILDATMEMNAAEREMESPDTKAKLYSYAQRSLSKASRYYQRLGSSARVKEALRMIGAVRNHQKLIPLAHDIIAEIASNKIIYAAISSTTLFDQSPENSARELDTAFMVLDVSTKQLVQFNENVVIDIALSNIGRGEAITVKIDEAIPEGLELLESNRINAKDRSLMFASKIKPGFSNRISVLAKPLSTGEFVWHPALVYMDAEGNYKISRAQAVKLAVESDELTDITGVLEKKRCLEEELRQLQNSSEGLDEQAKTEKVYSIRENISNIEESLLRLKNEYDRMNAQLEQVRSELEIISSRALNTPTKEKAELLSDEKMLLERIERRRPLLEQARLL